MKEYTVIIERDDENGMYVGEVPGIAGCHTQGKTIEELMERMKEVIELCHEVGVAEETPSFIEIKKIRLPA